MEFEQIYNKAYHLYTSELMVRNICVAIAMLSAIGHDNKSIMAFFLLGLIAHLTPIMRTYLNIATKSQPDFYAQLKQYTQALTDELAELQTIEDEGVADTVERNTVESAIDQRDKQMEFINRLS